MNEKHLAHVTVEIYMNEDEADEEDEEDQLKVENPVFVFKQYLVNSCYFSDVCHRETLES